ncbi:transposase [Candidatus Gottesmanbacteria bacterium]|nr:transposase [Candidatus Gottesmanbacteria bacterium]
MPTRTVPLVVDECYHIYNRGVARQPVFSKKRDYEHFLTTISYYRFAHPPMRLSLFLELSESIREKARKRLETTERLVDILCFILMPNHFHLLLKQRSHEGVSTFLRRSVNSYSRYFTTKYSRPGALFQGVFKAIHIESNEQLLHLSRYIHLNPLVSFIVQKRDFLSYPWSSLPEYLATKPRLTDPTPIMHHFKTRHAYTQFILDQADYGKNLESIKHLTLENGKNP